MHPLIWPTALYLLAALAVPRFRERMGHAAYNLAILLSGVLAFLLTLWIVQRSSGEPLQWILSDWGELVGGGTGAIRFRLDGLAASFLLLSGYVGLAALVGSLDEEEEVSSQDYQAGLLVLLGGLVLLGLADNPLTLLLAGLLVDVGLIYGLGLAGRPRWLLITMLHGMAAQGIFLAGLLALWRESGGLLLAEASPSVLLILVAGIVVRLAPLPVSLLPVAFESLPQRVLAMLPLATLGVGSVWLVRVGAVLATMGPVPQMELVARVGALGVALGGWVAWRSEVPAVRLMMLSAVQASWVLWAFAWGLPGEAVAIAWGGLLALATLAIHGGKLDFRHGAQLPGVVAALMLAGFPGSALWGAATLLSGAAWRQQEHGLLALGVVGTMTSTVALVQWLVPEESEPYQHSRWTGVILLGLLSVPFVALLWGIELPSFGAGVPSGAPLVAQVAMLVLGWAGGVLLWRDRARFHSLYPLLDTLAAFFSFAWLWRFLGWVTWLVLSGLRGMVLVLEGENYGWLLLFLFVTLLFLLPR